MSSSLRGVLFATAVLALLGSAPLVVQAADTPDLNGAWARYGGFSRTPIDPKLAAPRGEKMLLKPQYAKPYEARRAKEEESDKNGEPIAAPGVDCLPYGMPEMMSAIYPLEILQTPRQVTIVAEAMSQVRRIYLDKPQVKIGDFPPGYYGHSVGHWEGDTLVVDVTGFNDQSWFDRAGDYHTDALHVVERYTLHGTDTLMYEATIEDKNVFTRPWKISMPIYRRQEKNVQLMEFKCVEFVEELMYGPLRKKSAK
jgi:hypothetical protein